MKPLVSICVVVAAVFLPAASAETPTYKSKYAGQEKRLIKSLSDDDIEQLKNGKGWGLAKAAELNGMPGPLHILQMKDQVSLTPGQEVKIQALFENMKSKAIPLGNELIELEKTLNESFADRTISKQQLSQQLDEIAKVKKELRYVHLETHLATPAILSTQQLAEYNRLRGYDAADPCTNVPEGHDAKMWRKHNDCNQADKPDTELHGMLMSANGTFEVDLKPQEDEGFPAGRMLIAKTYAGDMEGTGTGQMISKRIDGGAAAYFAVEEYSGTVGGKSGTFTLLHNGYMDNESRLLEINILTGSGTGELEGVSGSMRIIQDENGHAYEMDYEL